MNTIDQAVARLSTSAGWFEDLSPAAKKEYIRTHPNSKYAKKGGGTGTKSKPSKRLQERENRRKQIENLHKGDDARDKLRKAYRKTGGNKKALDDMWSTDNPGGLHRMFKEHFRKNPHPDAEDLLKKSKYFDRKMGIKY